MKDKNIKSELIRRRDENLKRNPNAVSDFLKLGGSIKSKYYTIDTDKICREVRYDYYEDEDEYSE